MRASAWYSSVSLATTAEDYWLCLIWYIIPPSTRQIICSLVPLNQLCYISLSHPLSLHPSISLSAVWCSFLSPPVLCKQREPAFVTHCPRSIGVCSKHPSHSISLGRLRLCACSLCQGQRPVEPGASRIAMDTIHNPPPIIISPSPLISLAFTPALPLRGPADHRQLTGATLMEHSDDHHHRDKPLCVTTLKLSLSL